MMEESTVTLKNGEEVIIRILTKEDVKKFGIFLESLSENTKSSFGPHPLTREEAESICSQINDSQVLRLIAVNKNQEIVGYLILSLSLRESQVLRYKEQYEISLENFKDACIAPVMADKYQKKGLGSFMLAKAVRLAKELKIRRLILWQGVQSTNLRAIHFYEKFGFVKNGEFDRYDTHNIDMTLELDNN